jgi:iron complex outermembrane receptor protein
MHSIIRNRLLGSAAVLAAGLFTLTAPAAAQQVAVLDTSAGSEIETVVVTGTAFNADVAPAKSSLETMEPQTIINKSYIQDSAAETADFTTILAIAPSMTGQDINGPGLSDGNVKNTLRGLPDGNYVMAYDGIPFGDTNGPSHHSESYFPGVTIGSIDVDRGPGNAGSLGAATFGGSVNMFSEALVPDSQFKVTTTAGSFGTFSVNGNAQTGDFDLGGVTTRALINLNDTGSSGYLSHQNTSRQNALVKLEADIGNGWKLTAFANYNGLFQHVNDNNGYTAAQITTYGKTFGLQINNPNSGTYQAYNPEGKKTDLDYLRLRGDISDTLHLDDTAYTYAYVNKTFSSSNVTQTQADIFANVTEGNGTVVNGKKFAGDVPGYTKQNAYRVWGNILRVADDFDLGWLTGQLRGGLWWESSASQRARFDFDATQCIANGCNPWHNQTYADSSLSASTLGAAKAKSSAFGGGFAEYVEHSGWSQYQPFAELELHPLDGLTITPGIKYVSETLSVNAPLEQKTVPVVPFQGSFTSTRTLPFLMANYKIQPSWSVYAQYAQGIYLPDISSFEQSTPVLQFPKAETTTNYQVGTVYYADNFTIDGDLYYIGVNNNIGFSACSSNPSETCAVNTGTAQYKGVEGEGTYLILDGLSAFASGSVNYTRTAGAGAAFAGVLKNAPLWTEATGLVYKSDDFKLSLINKVVGQQYVGKQTMNAAQSAFYKLPAYSNMDFKGSMALGPLELGIGLNNLLNQRNLLAMTVNDKTNVGANVSDLTNRGGSLDQYYFSPSRSAQISLTARF